MTGGRSGDDGGGAQDDGSDDRDGRLPPSDHYGLLVDFEVDATTTSS